MSNDKCKPFKVTLEDDTSYSVQIKSIKGVPEDRYGWEKDHLAIWVEFSPQVIGLVGTFLSIPVREYDPDSLMVAVMGAAEKAIRDYISKHEDDKRDQLIADAHQSELDVAAAGISKLLEVN